MVYLPTLIPSIPSTIHFLRVNIPILVPWIKLMGVWKPCCVVATQIFLECSPRKLGKMNPFWRINMFQRGWFNHQLAVAWMLAKGAKVHVAYLGLWGPSSLESPLRMAMAQCEGGTWICSGGEYGAPLVWMDVFWGGWHLDEMIFGGVLIYPNMSRKNYDIHWYYAFGVEDLELCSTKAYEQICWSLDAVRITETEKLHMFLVSMIFTCFYVASRY